MDMLRRIDKGYALVRKAKRRIEKILDVPIVHEMEKEIEKQKQEEGDIRAEIDRVKCDLLEKEKFLAEKEKEIGLMLRTLYDRSLIDEYRREELQQQQQQLVFEKEQAEKEMFRDFALIDEYTKKLYRHKHSMGTLERKLSKQRVKQHEKIVYLEDKIKVMEKKIRKLRKTVDTDRLYRYDLRREQTEIVFAKVECGCCKICGKELSDESKVLLQQNIEIVECGQCHRILYIEENEEQKG